MDENELPAGEPTSQIGFVGFPDSLRTRLYSAARDAGVSMSQLAISILDEHLPPLPERRT